MSMPRARPPLETRLRTNEVAKLCKLFDEALAASEGWRAFNGPTAHFYTRVLTRRRAIPFNQLSGDSLFLDHAYAALATWMCSPGPDVTDFEKFCVMLPRYTAAAGDLANTSILDLSEPDAELVVSRFTPLFDSPGLTTSQTPSIVPTSKLLHFLLPDLVPPIDRRYSLAFFFGRPEPPSGYSVSQIFLVIFLACVAIGREAHVAIRRAVQEQPLTCAGHAKVIDNAVVGYMKLMARAIQE
jgi:hypothetical protein